MINFAEFFSKNKIIPIVTIDNLEDAVPLATALYQAGARTLEVTLRTENALAAIKAISEAKPDMFVGAGTITSTDDILKAKDHGAKFLVSPGINATLLKKAKELNIPYIPGVASPSDILLAKEYGYSFLKFFPAETAGGLNMLKIFADVFRDIKLCPTGGLNHQNFKKYLEMKNVFAVGGSWLAEKDIIKQKRWKDISHQAETSFIMSRM